MAHHSIGSIREMVRQYREELSCQTVHSALDGRMLLESNEEEKRFSSPHDKRPPNHGTPIHARTGTCRFRMVDLAEFQDLDRRAAEVLRRSQRVISEGRQPCESPTAPHVSKRRPHSPNTVERRSDRNRDVVARNFEEIDKILGESNLIVEQSSSSDTKVLSYAKGGVDTPRMLQFELRQGINHVKQDVEAREVAAIKAANAYLNKSNGHSNILLENIPKICAEEVLITACRRSLYPSVDMTTDQACPSDTNKHEVSLPSSTLRSCNGTKVCESTTTPTTLSESKRVPVPESERQWLSESEVDFASMKGTWKYADKFNFGEDFALATVETQQFPKRKHVKKPCKNRDMCSIHMPASFGQDPDLLVSGSQSCAGRDLRKEVSCLELDNMKQLSTEDLLLILENPQKVRASLRSRDRIWEGRGTYCPQRYLSPGKTSIVGDFESSFAGDNGEEAGAYSGILASVELQEAFDRTSAPASGSHRYVLKRDAFQRSKVRHSEDATQQSLGSSAKYRGTKDKGNRSPAWMQSLNVRKPSKWRAMSNTHTRSAASLTKGTVAVEGLEELALRCNQPEGAATVNNKTILEEDVDYRASIPPNDNLVVDHCKKTHSPASNDLPSGIISLPRVVTIRENPHVSLAPTNESTFSSGLNSLISEVVHEWVEECSTSSPTTSVSPDIGPITEGQALETGNWSADGDLAIKKTLPTDSELVKVARKKSVEALASVVQALQEAEVDEAIVTEFEADETVRLLLEKLHFYEKRIRALKKREDGNFETENSAQNQKF